VAGVWRFQDLVAWRLAVELKEYVDLLCQRQSIRKDFRFHSQLSDAAASGPRNIAEGFGRHYHPDFARFVRIAKASLLEVLNHLIDAHRKGHITAEELDRGDHAVKKALKAVNGLIRHLESTPNYGRKHPSGT
jgi:four helix bundle protein